MYIPLYEVQWLTHNNIILQQEFPNICLSKKKNFVTVAVTSSPQIQDRCMVVSYATFFFIPKTFFATASKRMLTSRDRS